MGYVKRNLYFNIGFSSLGVIGLIISLTIYDTATLLSSTAPFHIISIAYKTAISISFNFLGKI